MAFARDVYSASGSQTDFTITFNYLTQSTDVKVYQNGTLLTLTTDYTFPSSTVMRLNSGATAADAIVLQRATSQSTRLTDYTPGSLTESDLDTDSLQAFYMAQEAIDIANTALGKNNADSKWDATTLIIENVVDPVADQDAATKAYVDAAAAGTLGTPLSVANGGTAGATEAAAIASLFTQGTDIASATTPTIPTNGNYFDVTGTTTITGFTVAINRFFILQFDGALTLTHGASLALPTAANITTAAGDVAICYATAANTVKVLHFLDQSITYTDTAGAIAAVIAADNAWTGNQYFTPMTDSSSAGALTVDFTDGNYAEVALTENITAITLNNMQAGGTYKIRFEQHTSSTYTVTGWPAAVIWPFGDTEPVMNTAADKYTMVTIEAGSGNSEHCGTYVDIG